MEEHPLTAAQVTNLLRFARVLTGDRGLAEDLVQDVLVTMLRARRPIENLDAYTRRMILTGYLSWRRKWSRVLPSAYLPEDADPGDGFATVEARGEIDAALQALTRKQRAAVVLRFWLDLSDVDAASELGCSVATYRSHISRGLAALRIELSPEVTP